MPSSKLSVAAIWGAFAFSFVLLGAACAKNGDELLGTIDAPVTPEAGIIDPGFCPAVCSADKRSVIDSCHPDSATTCGPAEECVDAKCVNACQRAEEGQASIGCDYYAVMMDIIAPDGVGACFVSFVTNTFSAPAHLQASLLGKDIDLEQYAKLPSGHGKSLEYLPYDPARGLLPGEVAILFLANFGSVKCPVPAPLSTGAWVKGTGIGNAFHVQSDVPVVAFQMLPYGGGNAAMTGASLLLPTSVWGTNYVAVNAYKDSGMFPSMDIVAVEDKTTIQVLPRVDIKGLEGMIPSGKAGKPVSYILNKGEVLQFSQSAELTGSPISSDKKIGVFGGHQCMDVPEGVGYCDHAEQQIPPVRALGNEYVAVPHRPRKTDKPENYLWRVVGAADGTELTYDPPTVVGPPKLDVGGFAEFNADGPFVVKSQDKNHPFMLFGYMTGGQGYDEYGDPDFVRVISPAQYLNSYVFFTDPTYPETNLTVVRQKHGEVYEDVSLDCYGVLGDWTPLGADYEVTRIDLVRHDFEAQGQCDNGVHSMSSKGLFGLSVWGWGTPETSGGVCNEDTPKLDYTCDVSYAYPAGERVTPINDVVVGPPVN